MKKWTFIILNRKMILKLASLGNAVSLNMSNPPFIAAQRDAYQRTLVVVGYTVERYICHLRRKVDSWEMM